jgi:hypothetical protein
MQPMVLIYLPTFEGDFVRANVDSIFQHHGSQYGYISMVAFREGTIFSILIWTTWAMKSYIGCIITIPQSGMMTSSQKRPFRISLHWRQPETPRRHPHEFSALMVGGMDGTRFVIPLLYQC